MRDPDAGALERVGEVRHDGLAELVVGVDGHGLAPPEGADQRAYRRDLRRVVFGGSEEEGAAERGERRACGREGDDWHVGFVAEVDDEARLSRGLWSYNCLDLLVLY